MMKLSTTRFILVLLCVSAVELWSCTEQFEDTATGKAPEQTEQTISLKNVVFHEGTQSWIRPQKDPYALANFQQAYDNLSSGKSTQPLTRSQAAEFSATNQLQPTHYCVKIYPRDETEQWKVERMEDVKVAYVPFDYIPLTEQQTESLTITRSEAEAFSEKNPHILIYDNLETIEGPVPAETHILPILYAVWPCEKPLPEDLDYEVNYPTFLPSEVARSRNSGLGTDAMRTLEREAINLALGISAHTKTTRSTTITNFEGCFRSYDTLLKKDISLGDLKVRGQLGSSIWDTYTISNGCFKIAGPIPTEAMVSYILQNTEWKITREDSTAPLSGGGLTTVADWLHYDPEVGINPIPTFFIDFTVHRAVSFFYKFPHEVPKWYYDAGIRIRILNRQSEDGTTAYTTFSSKNPAYISIYQNEIGRDNDLLGTVFHELGHFCHYGERGGYEKFMSVHNLLCESYASYVGWYLAERYYWSRHYEKPFANFDISYQGRQYWKKTNTGNISHYSPLFTDLIDDLNQNLVRGNSYNPDPIKNVPHSVILRISKECTNWASCKKILQEYVGVYYTSTELNTFLTPYDYWFANN